MLFELTPEQRAFREELCAFFTTEITPEARASYRDENEAGGGWSLEFRHTFRRKLGERGYIGMGWPEEYGGGGKDAVHQMILVEEAEYHAAPNLEPSVTYVPQAIIAFGSEEQKRFFLPRLRRGEICIFLGYSEPDAGSDLANLKARAEEKGDSFVITGEKVYSTNAHFSEYGLVAARTDPASSRHRGISLFLVDMRSPGITINEYRSVAGFHHHSVHFDGVPVPRNMMLGALHEGWRVLMGAVDFERAVIGAPGMLERQLDRLIQGGLQPVAGSPAILDDPVARDQVASLAVEVEAARLYAYKVAEMQAKGERPQQETSLSLLLKRETACLADEIGMQLLGPYGQLRGDSPYAPFAGAVEQDYREHIYYRFAAGGFDITRNVIAARGLKLPR